jgi:hypothetical protein
MLTKKPTKIAVYNKVKNSKVSNSPKIGGAMSVKKMGTSGKDMAGRSYSTKVGC